MTLGFSGDKLGNIQAFVKSYVDDGKLPGYLCLVSRYGEEAHFVSYGMRDVERRAPISRDTVFRIYSMTKPITSVALMMLYEKGAFQLDDPVAKYIPQWRDLKVFAGGDEKSYQVTAPARPMSVKDLLTHCSGLTYGFLGTHPVDAMYRAAKIGGGVPGATLAGMIEDLARLPLQFSPGTQWNYSVSTDVLGYLVQVFADQDFDQFVADKITRPLGWTTPVSSWHRRTTTGSPRATTASPPRTRSSCRTIRRRVRISRAQRFYQGAAAWCRRSTTTTRSRGCCSAKAWRTTCGYSAARPSST